MRKAGGSLSDNSAWVWADVPQGGGGYATGPNIHPTTGRQFLGTDTCGCYIRDPDDAKWTPVFTTASLQSADYTTANSGGWSSHRGCFAPSNANRLYAHFNGYWFKVTIDPAKALTDDGAITCARWPLGAKWIMSGAGWNRWWTCHPSVHPTDEDTVMLPTSNDGVYYSTDGLATVNAISVPACTALSATSTNIISKEVGRDQYMVWIDQGNPLYCYVFVQGSGLYASTTGVSGAFSLISGGPTAASCMVGEADGTVWITGDDRVGTTNGGLWSITRGGAFVSYGNPITGSTNAPHHVAVDPFDGTVIVWREQPGAYSTNAKANGASGTWTQQAFVIATGGECTWRPKSAPQMGGMCFDPTTQGRILCGEGFGAIVIAGYKTATLQALDYSKGMEQRIDTGFVVHPTTGKTFVRSWDLPNTEIASLTNYTNIPMNGPVEAPGVQIGGQIDFAIDDPTFWVQSMGYGANDAYSEDEGAPGTWHKFAGTLPATANTYGYAGSGAAGSIAVGNKNDIVIAPSNDAYASESSDGGATWSPLLLSGSKDYSTNHAYFINPRVILSADKEQPGWFAMVVMTAIPNTSNFTSPYGGLWVRPGSGQAWVQVISGNINGTGAGVDTTQYYGAWLRHVPGFAGELLYTAHDNLTPTNYTNDPFWWIVTDGTPEGTTKTNFNALIKNVRSFAFGKALPGQSRPAVYFFGDYNGVTGNWATFDWGASVIQISDAWPHGYIGPVAQGVGADLTTFGRAFCTFNGRGSVYSTYQDMAHAI